jgi:predicted ATPase
LAQASQGQRQVVFITGEPGIGKTTLVEAFATHDTAMGRVTVARGQCIEQYGAGEPYLPVLEALSRLARGPRGQELLAVLRRQAPSWLLQMPAFVSPAEHDLLQRLGGGATQTRMLRELAEALETISAKQPLVLILEDLHWSDVSTLEWLSYVARRSDRACLLVLGTYRPQETRGHAGPLHAVAQELQRHGQAWELALDYWSEQGVTAYLALRFGPQLFINELAQHLHQRTDGNPLFVVTMIDEMIRREVVIEGAKGWELPDSLNAIAVSVPESLRQLMEQQLVQLEPDVQRMLEAASVVGIEFSAAAVAAATEHDTEAVENVCTAMARQGQLIQLRGTASWPDATVATRLAFRHALYQEVLYNRVPAGRRVRWHQQIGTRLEAGFGPQAKEIAAELAMHYVRGQAPEQAKKYLRHAGDNALRRSAHQEAITHLRAALDILARLPESAQRDAEELEVQNALGVALIAIKGFASLEVVQVYTRARELWQALGETPELTPVLWGLWWFHETRVELETAHRLAQQLLAVAQQAKDSGPLLQAHRAMGQSLYWRGELAQAQSHFEQGIALYDPRQHGTSAFLYGQDPGVGLRNFSALISWHQGYPDAALERINESVALAYEVAHPFSTAFALSFLTWVHHYRRDAAATRAQAEAAIALCREHGFAFFLAQQTVLRGWALVEQGQTAEAVEQMRHGIVAYSDTGAVAELPYLTALLGEACGKTGRVQEGLSHIEEGLAIVERQKTLLYEGELSRLKGELMLLQADSRSTAAAAEKCFRHSLDVAREQGARCLELRAAMSLCRLPQWQNKPRWVRELLSPVYEAFSEGLETADLRDAEALLKR